MHNGSTIPNIFLLDYLVSQKIIPLVAQVVNAQKDILKEYLPHYFNTPTEIKIIEEIIKIKFSHEDFRNKNNIEEITEKFFRLAHLKELGRAAFTIEYRFKQNSSFYEPYYHDPIGRNKRFAQSESSHESFHSIKKCPCCGTETLVIYRKGFTDVFTQSDTFISWMNCLSCSYSLKNNVGDPYDFGLSEEYLFAQE
jgi:hypothetical protein